MKNKCALILVFSIGCASFTAVQVAVGASENACKDFVADIVATRPPADLAIATSVAAAEHSVAVAHIWDQPELVGSAEPDVMRGILVWEVARFLKKERTLPLQLVLLGRLNRQYKASGYTEAQWTDALAQKENSIDLLVLYGRTHLPEVMDDIGDRLLAIAAEFVSDHLTAPTIADIAQQANLKGSQATRERIVAAFLPATHILEAVLREDPEILETITDKITKAFTRATFQLDRPKTQRTQPTRPSMAAILDALIHPKANASLKRQVMAGSYGVAQLETLIQQVFGSVAKVEELARDRNRGRFNSYRPSWANIERMRELANIIEEKPGFLITSVNAGIPLKSAQLRTMLAMAVARDMPIIVIPTAQILDEIPPELLDNPRIFILTHTINNSALSISNIGILPKNYNPTAGLLRRRQFLPGQIKIIGHPQVSMVSVPTGLNHVGNTLIYSTGSLSEDLYPSALPVQLRTSEIAKQNHTNAFLVVEKADAKSGLDGSGAANSFHVRPVEFTSLPDDPRFGFTDLGTRYSIDRDDPSGPVRVDSQEPEVLVRGDLHDAVSDQRYMDEYGNVLAEFGNLNTVIDHDSLDGESFKHWDFENTRSLAQAYAADKLNVEREYMGLLAGKNAILAVRPGIEITDINSNHPRWMVRLMQNDKFPQYMQILNLRIIDELRMAQSIYGIQDPLEWFLKYRNKWLDSLPPLVQMQYAGTIRISDPSRVRVLRLGEPLSYGPRHRQTQLENHGDKGPGGAKGSANSHSAGNLSSVTGDSHVPAMLGGWINVGTSTSTRLSYSMGGYSAWANAAALIYPDGTKQLVIFQSHISSLWQRPANGLLSSSQFFGRDHMIVRENDNDSVPDSAVLDQYGGWFGRWRSLVERFAPTF